MNKKWNEIEVEKVIEELESNKNGLSNEEANINNSLSNSVYE
ncbi:MAG: hypothetical protein ACI312_00285 [Bacilli bacterium]